MGRTAGGAGASDRRGGGQRARPSSPHTRRPRPARAGDAAPERTDQPGRGIQRGAAGADGDLDAATASVGSPDAALLAEIRSAAGPRDKERAATAFSRAVVALAAGDVQVA